MTTPHPHAMSAVENIRAALDDATNGPWIGAGPSFGAPHAEYLDSVVEDVDHERDYATQAVTEDRAQRDAEHLAELRAYELTVSNLREKAEQLDADLNGWAERFRKAALERNALREQLMDKERKDTWNRKCRTAVDTLLQEAGYSEESSARNALGMMNFDPLAQQAQQAPMTNKGD